MLTWSVRLATPLTAPAVTAIQTVMRVVGSRLKLNIRSLSSRTITASSSEAGVLPEDQGDRGGQAQGEEEELQDVGPDNGLHAAHQGVGGGHRRGQDDGNGGLDSGELLDGQGDGHHDGGHPGQAGDDEDRAGQQPGGKVEPQFQVFVDRGHLQPVEEVQKQVDRQGHAQKSRRC